MLPVSDPVSELSSLSCERGLPLVVYVAQRAVDSDGKDDWAKLPVACEGCPALPLLSVCSVTLPFVLEPGLRAFNLGWQVRKETKSLQSNG